MRKDEVQDTLLEPRNRLSSRQRVPVLLVAHAPQGSVDLDRSEVHEQVRIGRSPDCELCIAHGTVSRCHARIERDGEDYFLVDQGSKNGCYLDSARVHGRALLSDQSLIRIGQAVLVFLRDGSGLLAHERDHSHGLAGRFYRGAILMSLLEASVSARHVLLTGPSGSGKELAARALSEMLGDERPLPFIVQNCAQFASEEEAATSLFGVRHKVFSGVDARTGLIELADGGILFLDEAHGLPPRVQRSLLRIIEDGELRRIGDPSGKSVQVRFVLASNLADNTFGLTHDLCARLRVVRVPSLAERLADIPEIFEALLEAAVRRAGVDPGSVAQALTALHYEALCLRAVGPTNIRALVDIADRIASRLRLGSAPQTALDTVMSEQLGLDEDDLEPRSSVLSEAPLAPAIAVVPSDLDAAEGDLYELHRAAITTTFWQTNGNISAIARMLQEKGVACSRRRLAVCLVKWGLRRA